MTPSLGAGRATFLKFLVEVNHGESILQMGCSPAIWRIGPPPSLGVLDPAPGSSPSLLTVNINTALTGTKIPYQYVNIVPNIHRISPILGQADITLALHHLHDLRKTLTHTGEPQAPFRCLSQHKFGGLGPPLLVPCNLPIVDVSFLFTSH